MAEYEDIGYEPFEIAPLLRARDEGRLVEHPCKVGDTVWAIDWCSKLYKGYSCPYSCSSGQRDRVFRKNCIQYCRIFKATYMQSMLGEFGKTVFLTKADAQKRLEEKANARHNTAE